MDTDRWNITADQSQFVQDKAAENFYDKDNTENESNSSFESKQIFRTPPRTMKRKRESSIIDNGCHQNDSLQKDYVNHLFKKRFTLTFGKNYMLPKPECMFQEDLWNIEELQILKKELNNVKSCLNDFILSEWQIHTKTRNEAGNVLRCIKKNIEPEFITQAWCKFYEIAASFPIVPLEHIVGKGKQFISVHLCEAPGAFVASLNHWLKTNLPNVNWNWIATTLNPYYEGNSLSRMIDDDRFLRHTLKHWCFGKDITGNLMNWENLEELVQRSIALNGNVLLVTADGSIDCSELPGEQENTVSQLHFCESVAALCILSSGGSFVLKIFTIFECRSVCLMYLLSCCFKEVSVIKPTTSKAGNSEVYVVCLNFKGPEYVKVYLPVLKRHYDCSTMTSLFAKNDIPYSFIQKVIKCSRFFKNQQCKAIMTNIRTFKQKEYEEKTNYTLRKIQYAVANKYIKQYNLKKLLTGEIVGKMVLTESINLYTRKKKLENSYNERCRKRNQKFPEKLMELLEACADITSDILPGIPKKLKIDNIPEELWICTGKQFSRIHSSRFCEADILEIKNTIYDNVDQEMQEQMSFPPNKHVETTEKSITANPNQIVVAFRYGDFSDSHAVISKIFSIIQSLKVGQNLILIGYSLLTCVSVGLLHLIGYSFNALEIKVHHDLGCQIILQHYNYSMKVLHHLETIKIASNNATEQGASVLSIFPITFLYDSKLFTTIVDVNHWNIKLHTEYIIKLLTHKTQKNMQQIGVSQDLTLVNIDTM